MEELSLVLRKDSPVIKIDGQPINVKDKPNIHIFGLCYEWVYSKRNKEYNYKLPMDLFVVMNTSLLHDYLKEKRINHSSFDFSISFNLPPTMETIKYSLKSPIKDKLNFESFINDIMNSDYILFILSNQRNIELIGSERLQSVITKFQYMLKKELKYIKVKPIVLKTESKELAKRLNILCHYQRESLTKHHIHPKLHEHEISFYLSFNIFSDDNTHNHSIVIQTGKYFLRDMMYNTQFIIYLKDIIKQESIKLEIVLIPLYPLSLLHEKEEELYIPPELTKTREIDYSDLSYLLLRPDEKLPRLLLHKTGEGIIISNEKKKLQFGEFALRHLILKPITNEPEESVVIHLINEYNKDKEVTKTITRDEFTTILNLTLIHKYNHAVDKIIDFNRNEESFYMLIGSSLGRKTESLKSENIEETLYFKQTNEIDEDGGEAKFIASDNYATIFILNNLLKILKENDVITKEITLLFYYKKNHYPSILNERDEEMFLVDIEDGSLTRSTEYLPSVLETFDNVKINEGDITKIQLYFIRISNNKLKLIKKPENNWEVLQNHYHINKLYEDNSKMDILIKNYLYKQT